MSPSPEPPRPEEPRAASGHANGAAKSRVQGIDALLDQVQALQHNLREALAQTHHVQLGLKQHRRQARAVSGTLAMLRQLQPIDA